MGLDVRTLETRSELVEAAGMFRTAMIGLPRVTSPDDSTLARLFEPGRTLAAFEDGRMVGTTNSWGWDIVIPGGERLPQAAVTHVGVPATNVRRGIARALMTAQLRAARDAGDAMATLRATQGTIYGNFGYGVANATTDYAIDRRVATLRKDVVSAKRLRFVDPDLSWDMQASVYQRQPMPRVGTISRPERWWIGPAARLGMAGQIFHVVTCGPEGAETGYVRYRPQPGRPWVDNDERTIVVDDLAAHDDDDYAALIGHLLSIDIAHRILLPVRPVDDPLPFMLTDWRSAGPGKCQDETWIRLLDSEAALTRRSYRGAGAVVLEVVDPIIPENTVRLRLSSGGAERCSAPADVTADVAAASSAYLGGTAWWQLAAAGRLSQATPAAVAALDDLFVIPRQPFSGTMF